MRPIAGWGGDGVGSKLSWQVCRKQCQRIRKMSILLDFKVEVQLGWASLASTNSGLCIESWGSAADTNFKTDLKKWMRGKASLTVADT